MKIFYGWWVLLGLFLVYTATNGILIHTLPLMYPELIKEFGWDAEEVTRPASIFFLVVAIITPFMGALADRFSTRMVTLAGCIILVAALAYYPSITSLNQMMIIYLVFSLGLAASGLVPNMLILTRWFERYRGIAVGVLLMGSSMGGALFPLIVKDVLIDQGWREAMTLVAIIGGVMMIVPLIILVRNFPQDRGLYPDGRADAEPEAIAATPESRGADMTLLQALKTPTFYLLAFCTGALWFCIVGVLQHQSIYMTNDLGVDMAKVPVIFSLFFWCAIVGKLLFGYLGDRFNKTMIMLLAITNLFIALFLLRTATADSMTTLYLYAIVCGIGFSAGFTMVQVLIAEFFSGASFGKILGVFTMIDSIAGAMGIKYLASVKVARDGYAYGLEVMMGLCVAAAVCVCVLIFRHRNARASLASAST